MSRSRLALFILVLLALVGTLFSVGGSHLPAAASENTRGAVITISGTVTGPDGPASNVWMGFGTGADWQETTTDANGHYSVDIESGDGVSFHLRPPLETRLAQHNLWLEGVTDSFTQDFSLESGYLLDIGTPVGVGWMEVRPLYNPLPWHIYYALDWQRDGGRYKSVLPPDIYYITAHQPDGNFFETTQAFDLRNGDVSSEMSLNTEFVHPVPFEPPDAARISFSPVDGLGEANVAGAAGSVLPWAHVLLVNLNSNHMAHTFSESDGSFSARLYAPPGSAIMIKHGPAAQDWDVNFLEGADQGALQFLNHYPSTIVHRPHNHVSGANQVPFAAAGGIDIQDQIWPYSVGAAWAITGTAGSEITGLADLPSADVFVPGDTVQVIATMRLYGPAIDGSTDLNAISVEGSIGLQMIHDEAGRPMSATNQQGSVRLTASGLPILHQEQARIWVNAHPTLSNPQYVGGNAVQGEFNFTIQLPADLPIGQYRPVVSLDFQGVPTDTQWHAMPVNSFTFWSQEAPLPPITVQSAADTSNHQNGSTTAKLAWYILMDNASLGTRGTGAREDQDSYQTASFVVTQGAPYIAPMTDARASQPILYRLEPFLPMVSFTDRTISSPPLIPFELPGGQLCVSIREPDGVTRDLGCEAFKQSFQRTATSRSGLMLNNGSIQIDEIYSLMAGSDRFWTTFSKYGHHVITLNGSIKDIWGNEYQGGGTYDIWVAHPLDMDPGVLPGTPLDTSDAFNPAIQLHPKVPADVSLTLTHYPYSDPTQAVTHTISGQANSYGYFGGDEQIITLSEPGEYRVDVLTSYTDKRTGELYMSAGTWGGIVMTPPGQAQLIAHGRRGIDNLDYIPGQWFVNCQLDPPPPAGSVPHTLTPYFNGDLLWSRGEVDPICDGFALRLAASVQDPVGDIEAAIQTRYDRTYVPLQPPGDFSERLAVDELPLFSSTTSGRPVQVASQDTDQIAYAYLSAQRPGVRVREAIAEDGQSSGYWRLDAMYDNQLGVGAAGDLPNDFKFQYIGAVYRDLERGVDEYVGHGSGWIHLSDADQTGSRVMPPFSGPGNGGWTTQGGPLITLKGEQVHMFILPTGVRPGAILEVGATFRFAGHLMPTLNSMVDVTVTAPSGAQFNAGGRANQVGYFYDPNDDFAVNEPGLWTVDVVVWHDGQIGTGEQVNCAPGDPFNPSLPCPSGNVLGSDGGRYWFYALPEDAERLSVFSPRSGFLSFDENMKPITIHGPVPAELSDVSVDYTIGMPGYILEQGQATVNNGMYTLTFDPAALHEDFPNLDLTGRGDWEPGLSDTFAISLLMQGQSSGHTIHRANVITIQGEQVFVDNGGTITDVYLPFIEDFLPSLGPAFILTNAGAITDSPNDVISGARSIKGSYTGSDTYTWYLGTDPGVMPLTPLHTHRITFDYRILATPDQGFETLFYSPIGGGEGNFLPSIIVDGRAGDQGSATLTNTLENYTDYRAGWNIIGTGAIAVDNIQIVNLTTGELVVVEDAEG